MKRFYKEVSVEETAEGYTIKLDAREVKTPMKAAFSVPTKALADRVAKEWSDQSEKIEPEKMHITRLANTAVDRVAARRQDIIDELIEYAGTDLICYYAEFPEHLVTKQVAQWQPFHDWIKSKFDVSLKSTSGIVHIAQGKSAMDMLRSIITDLDSYRLTAMHSFTTSMGSFSMGLALVYGQVTLDQVWPAAMVDEFFQEEEWGSDDEALEQRANLKADMDNTALFLSLV